MNMFEECKTVEQLLGEAIGAGSMCWESPGSAGEFQSSRARKIVDEAIERLESLRIYNLRDPLERSLGTAELFGLTNEDATTTVRILAAHGVTDDRDAGSQIKQTVMTLGDPSTFRPGLTTFAIGVNLLGLQPFTDMAALFGQLANAKRLLVEPDFQAAVFAVFGTDAYRLALIAATVGSDGFRAAHKQGDRA